MNRYFTDKGAVLIETMLTTLVWAALLASMHFVVIRFWNDSLDELDYERQYYDGVFQETL